jgi:hypothetical protein
MRSLLLFGVLSSSALAGERNLLVLPRAPEAAPKQKGFIHRFFDKIDGGDMHGFSGPDISSRKPENYLHTMPIRWKIKF